MSHNTILTLRKLSKKIPLHNYAIAALLLSAPSLNAQTADFINETDQFCHIQIIYPGGTRNVRLAEGERPYTFQYRIVNDKSDSLYCRSLEPFGDCSSDANVNPDVEGCFEVLERVGCLLEPQDEEVVSCGN